MTISYMIKGPIALFSAEKSLLKYNIQYLVVYKKLFYIQPNLIKSVMNIKHCKIFLTLLFSNNIIITTKHVQLLLIFQLKYQYLVE